MALITNPKIGYRSFPGYSLLFDNPGEENYRNHAGKLELIEYQPGSVPFYDAAIQCMDKLGGEVCDQHGLLPLNPASYHVTVWDGVNVANVEQVLPESRVEARNFLHGIPFSIRSGKQMMCDVADSPLAGWRGNMQYSFDRLAIIADYVLVVLLRPAGEPAQITQRSIEHFRTELSTQYQAHYGITPAGEHMPHLSLGYFLRHQDGRNAMNFVAQWNELMRDALTEQGEPLLEFESAGLYGFTDMEHFYRATASPPSTGAEHAVTIPQ